MFCVMCVVVTVCCECTLSYICTVHFITVFKIIHKKKLSSPKKGAMFWLRQFVTDCNMLNAIFLDF